MDKNTLYCNILSANGNQQLQFSTACQINPLNVHLEDLIHNKDKTRLASVHYLRWEYLPELKVHFLNGTPTDHSNFELWTTEWENYANIFILCGNYPNAPIRVRFGNNGNNSQLGTNALLEKDITKATMNIQNISRDTVLHEFGHVLSCIHEHQHPDCSISWDKPQVIKDLSGYPNFWSPELIESNMFHEYHRDILKSSYDTNSIMHYEIPANWTTNKVGIPQNTILSTTDMDFVKQMYPKRNPIQKTQLNRTYLSSESLNMLNEIAFDFDVEEEEQDYTFCYKGKGELIIALFDKKDYLNEIFTHVISLNEKENNLITKRLQKGNYLIRSKNNNGENFNFTLQSATSLKSAEKIEVKTTEEIFRVNSKNKIEVTIYNYSKDDAAQITFGDPEGEFSYMRPEINEIVDLGSYLKPGKNPILLQLVNRRWSGSAKFSLKIDGVDTPNSPYTISIDDGIFQHVHTLAKLIFLFKP